MKLDASRFVDLFNNNQPAGTSHALAPGLQEAGR